MSIGVKHEWFELPSGIWVSHDAVKLGVVEHRQTYTLRGARVMADELGGRLPRPEEIDERWENSLKLLPNPMNVATATAKDHDKAVTCALQGRSGLVANCGKHWCEDGAVYGWHVPASEREGSVWRGIPVYPSFSSFTKDWVIQKPYRGHGVHHVDYSMTLVLVKEMKKPEVPRVDTPIGELEMAQVLRNGYLGVYGQVPSWETTGVAWAQCMLESGRGRRMWNHNFGNITAGSRWTGQYYVMKVPPPDPPTLKFRSHASFHAGAKDYWTMLKSRYGNAVAAFAEGNPTKAAAELKARGYFTAELKPYAAAMAKLYKEFQTRIQPVL